MILIALVVAFAAFAGVAHWLGWGSHKDNFIQVIDSDGLSLSTNSNIKFETELSDELHIEWLGHSSFWIEWHDTRILLDPVLSSRVSLTHRLWDTPLKAESLHADAVLISHAHMDHMDNPTLESLPTTTLYLPAGSEVFLSDNVKEQHQVSGLKDAEQVRVKELTITRVPTNHGGWRYPWQTGYEACGYCISDGEQTIYFAGDTAWGNNFKKIGEVYHPNIAILPIGGYSPWFWLKRHHISPEQAVEAYEALGSTILIPCHFATYRVSAESHNAPLRRLLASKTDSHITIPVRR